MRVLVQELHVPTAQTSMSFDPCDGAKGVFNGPLQKFVLCSSLLRCAACVPHMTRTLRFPLPLGSTFLVDMPSCNELICMQHFAGAMETFAVAMATGASMGTHAETLTLEDSRIAEPA